LFDLGVCANRALGIGRVAEGWKAAAALTLAVGADAPAPLLDFAEVSRLATACAACALRDAGRLG
jgi:hypothetical protein